MSDDRTIPIPDELREMLGLGRPKQSPERKRLQQKQMFEFVRALWTPRDENDEDAKVATFFIEQTRAWFQFLWDGPEGSSRLLVQALEDHTRHAYDAVERLQDLGILRARGQGIDVRRMIDDFFPVPADRMPTNVVSMEDGLHGRVGDPEDAGA